jgi:hypothetical protein
MKQTTIAAALLCVFFQRPDPSFAQDLRIYRKAGMWEQTSVDISSGGQGPLLSMCTDEAFEQRFPLPNSQITSLLKGLGASNCTEVNPQKIPGGFRFELTCNVVGRPIHMATSVIGDFNSAYSAETVSVIDGKMQPSTRMSFRRTGACPANRKPGDIVMPGGHVMNFYVLERGANQGTLPPGVSRLSP